MDNTKAALYHTLLDYVFLLLIGGMCYGALYLTCQTFDKTEDRTWFLQMAGVVASIGAGKWGHKLINRRKDEEQEEPCDYCRQCPNCYPKRKRR